MLIDELQKRVLLCDGGHGTLLQALNLDVKKDLLGLENCFEILSYTRPEIMQDLHRAYLQVGADCIETDTFGANQVVLAEYNFSELDLSSFKIAHAAPLNTVYQLNLTAAELAREVAQEFATPERPRFVLGSMGPGTKLPSLGQIAYDELVDAYVDQARGLLDGKVDAFLLETNADLLTIKALLQACRIAKGERHDTTTPIFAQVTLDASHRTLIGSDINCIVTSLAAMKVDGIGLNCGLGPAEMFAPVRNLSEVWPGLISVMPNAGLPIVNNGSITYPLTPDELAAWQKRFIEECGVNLVGGCCGTTPAHIAAVRKMLDQRADTKPKTRAVILEPAVSSAFVSVPIHQENAVFAIGERTNANGSKQFRELLCAEKFDDLLAIAKEQEKQGSHALDVCVAYAGRREVTDMEHFISLLRGQVQTPVVIDSTEPKVIAAGLKLLGGKSIINSINFEDGEEKTTTVLNIARQFGAAVIGLTIDEEGMAKGVERKIAIAKRLYETAVTRHQLAPADLFIDPLTFTICTGSADDREHGINTLAAIRQISQMFPECQTLLGVSNVSFGLKPEAREVLNSIFLHHAREAGLTAAVIHRAKILPLHLIPKEQAEAAEDLIFNRWREKRDPLQHFIGLFAGVTKKEQKKLRSKKIGEALAECIIEGNKQELELLLKEALVQYSPLEIINAHLLPGMKTVGELFASGQTQLPFVLQSAETMKAAITCLEPFMQQGEKQYRGVMILATVKGDVHDIGKNLVDIILSNNGFKIINLGIKQPLENIVAALKEHQADALGMSGLLVKSTLIMKENLIALRELGINLPIILGGAALTREFVEGECRNAYGCDHVYYAGDVFDGLKWMEEIIKNNEQ